MVSLFTKEIAGFFHSLTGYIVVIIFLVVNSLFMWVFAGPMNLFDGGYATMDTLFLLGPWVFLMLIPAVTMRSFAEERRSGTLELLMTRPLSRLQIITAKYGAALAVVILALLPTLVYYFSVLALGNPHGNLDKGGTWGSYLGLLFLAGAYVAVGLFCSSLTDNVIIAFLLAAFLCLTLCYGFEQAGQLFSSWRSGSVIVSLGMIDHYRSLSRGVIDSRDLIYFLAVTLGFLLLTAHRLKPGIRLARLAISLAIVCSLAVILSSFFFRIDLTADRRYTLSPYTKKTLRGLDDVVSVKVYLDGELNIPFRKMQQRIRETLDEFRVYAGNKLQYEFINPFKDKDARVRDEVVKKLYDKGLRPSNIIDRDREGGSSEKIVFPGALITCRDIEVPVNLLKNTLGASAEQNINNSVQAIEFEFMRMISSLSADTVEKIAFLEGQGELDEYRVGDITRDLGWYFQVDRGSINGKPGILDQFKAVIIAKPTGAFREQDKFVLDQYIMHGGKVLWFIDLVSAELDSISSGGSTVALIRQPGIEDMLFRYGVRINPVLVQDIQCSMIPVNVALAGNPPDFRPAPWLYSPLLTPPSGHPVTRNLNLVSTEFTGCIDTLAARNDIRKTVLLRTSEFSRIINVPAVISLDEIRTVPQQVQFTDKYKPVAVLLEGSFETAFRNRMISGLFPDTAVKVTEKGKPTAMLVVADGDLIRNDVRPTPQGMMISPLGFDRYTNRTYGNKDFIINAIHYLTGHRDLISLRNRQLTLRLLDKARIREQRTRWALINAAGPPVVVILSGILYAWLRKRKFTRS